jgi:predicted AAA+ superfamily ATPase
MSIITRTLFPALQCALADQRVIVITGQRRVGKTTAARWLLDQAPTDNKLYLDLERLDQRAVFGESNYDLVLKTSCATAVSTCPGRPMWPWMRSSTRRTCSAS